MLRRTNTLYFALGGVVAVAALAGQSLFMPGGNGWIPSWTSSVRDLGLRLDGQPLEGATMVAGVLRNADKLRSSAGADEEILDLLGGFDRGYRMEESVHECGPRVELCSPFALSQKANLPLVYSKVKASPGQWALLLCKVRGEKALADMPLSIFVNVQDCISWGRERGIDLDKLSVTGHVDHGKSTLVGTVGDVGKFNAMGLGIEGAAKGDRVHIIPQRAGGWKLALCSVKDSALLLVEFGATKLSRAGIRDQGMRGCGSLK